MSEENKTIIRHYFEEVWNKGNLAFVDQNMAASYLNHDPALAGLPQIDGFKQRVTMIRAAFPDFQFTIDDMVAERDKVVARWTARGTNKSAFMGIPPTGKPVTVTGISPMHIQGGKIAEDWTLVDNLGLMQQLGVVPPPGQGGR